MFTFRQNSLTLGAMDARRGPRRPLLLLAMILVGCGGGHDSSVSGVVYLDDTPLSTGTVTFHPNAGGPVVYGQISPDGRYELRTGSETGLAPGEYRVTVMATEPTAPTAVGVAPPIGKPITPPRYATLQTTDLLYEIESGSNQIDVRLTTQPQ